MKRCSVCEEEKLTAEPNCAFYRDKNKKDGLSASCKECAKARARRWNSDNKIRVSQRKKKMYDPVKNRERHRIRREKNPELVKKQNRRAQAKLRTEKPALVKTRKRRSFNRNPGNVRIQQNRAQKKYRLNNHDLVLERARIDRIERHEIILQQQQAWRTTNRDTVNNYARTRRARNANASGVCSVEQLHARILMYGSRCWVCREKFKAIDHLMPLVLGGSNWPANLRPICNACNSRKGAAHPRSLLKRCHPAATQPLPLP